MQVGKKRLRTFGKNYNLIKMKFYFLIFFFFSNVTTLIYAQNYQDSLNIYYQNKDYETALYFANLQKEKLIHENDTIHESFPFLLHTIGTIHKFLGNFNASEEFYKRSIGKYNSLPDKIFTTSATLENSLAILYRDNNLFEAAAPLFKKVMVIRGDNLNKISDDYLFALLNYAYCLKQLKIYDQAEELYLQAQELHESRGEENTTSANTLNNLAEIYSEQGKYIAAEKLFEDSRRIYKKEIGPESLEYINVNSNYGQTLQNLGRFDQALSILKEVQNKNLLIYGTGHVKYATSTVHLASIYQDLYQYEKAKLLYKEALEILEKNNEILHPSYFVSLGNMALIYKSEGKDSQAEKLLLTSLGLKERATGKKNQDYVSSLTSIASHYQDIKNYVEAEILYLEAIDISTNVLGRNHEAFAAALLNLSTLYLEVGRISQAEVLGLEALEIHKMLFQKNHPAVLSSLNNLAAIYKSKKEYAEAEKIFLNIKDVFEEENNTNNPHYVTVLYNLAGINFDLGNISRAKEFYHKVLTLQRDDSTPSLYRNIALLEEESDNPDEASIFYNSFLSKRNILIYEYLSFLNEKELTQNLSVSRYQEYFPLSFLHRFSTEYDSLRIGVYENELLVKNLSLRNNRRIENRIRQKGDSILISKYLKYKESRIYLTALTNLSLDNQPENFYELLGQVQALEKELVRESSNFSQLKSSFSSNFKTVQENLKPDEVAIELVAFNYYDKKWTDSIQYSALVIEKGSKAPKYIPLFEEKQLEKILANTSESKKKDQIQNWYIEKDLSQLFIKPLLQQWEGIKTIFLSPAGLGHQINFSALQINDSVMLGEAYNLHVISSSAEVINYKMSTLNKKTEILLYGDIDYDNRKEGNNSKSGNFQEEFLRELATRSGATYWGYLPGTKQEVEQIHFTAKSNQFESTIMNGEKATEESVKQLDGKTNPYILHLATHGFFFSNPEKALPENKESLTLENNFRNISVPVYKTSEDPMMRSGLLFAGANHHWGKQPENFHEEDGILTAREIVNLDLSACELIVLSACDTGLGEIKGSDGVYGLQRAFKMAGVKNIIMSLWKVPDEQTAELFDIFYKEALDGKAIQESFKLAQSKMSEKYSPFYWAGFVLLQ